MNPTSINYYSQDRSTVRPSPPPLPHPQDCTALMNLLFKSWIVGSCRFQSHLFIPACVTSSEFTRKVVMKFLPAQVSKQFYPLKDFLTERTQRRYRKNVSAHWALGWYIKWNGPFRFGPTRIFGTTCKGGPLSVGRTEMSLSIWQNCCPQYRSFVSCLQEQ